MKQSPTTAARSEGAKAQAKARVLLLMCYSNVRRWADSDSKPRGKVRGACQESTAVMLGFWAEEIHGVRDVLDNK